MFFFFSSSLLQKKGDNSENHPLNYSEKQPPLETLKLFMISSELSSGTLVLLKTKSI